MAADITEEQIITLREACHYFPKSANGRPVHVSRLYRYTSHGCRGIQLESLQWGNTRGTSVQAIQRFLRRLTESRGHVSNTATEVNHSDAVASGKRLAELARSQRKRA